MLSSGASVSHAVTGKTGRPYTHIRFLRGNATKSSSGFWMYPRQFGLCSIFGFFPDWRWHIQNTLQRQSAFPRPLMPAPRPCRLALLPRLRCAL